MAMVVFDCLGYGYLTTPPLNKLMASHVMAFAKSIHHATAEFGSEPS